MTTDKLISTSKDQLALVLGFFSRLDSKLSVLLAVNTAMLAVLGTNAPPLKHLSLWIIVGAAFAIVLIGASIAFLYRGAFQQLKGGQGSLIYFRQIAQRTEHSFADAFKQQSEEEYVKDLLGQVWRNAQILDAKFDCLRTAFALLALALIPWVVTLVLFVTYNAQMRSILIK